MMEYYKLAELYESLEKVTSRYALTGLIADFLKKTTENEINNIILLISGNIFPSYSPEEVGVAGKLMIKAISKSTGINSKKINDMLREKGDLGLVAESAVKGKRQKTFFKKQLLVDDVINNLRKAAKLEGPGTIDRKIDLINELLSDVTPLEAKYLVRTVLGDLRMGVGEGILRDSMILAFLPVIVGATYKCSCGKILPRNLKKCPYCNTPLRTKNYEEEIKELLKNLKNKKVLIHENLSSLINKKNEFKTFKEPEKQELKDYDYLISENLEKAKKFHERITEIVQRALDLTNDFGMIAELLFNKGINALKEISLTVGKPVKVMLFQKAENVNEAFKAVGKPASCEFKLDGLRVQIHKDDKNIKIFTRRLEEITKQFPELVKAVAENIKAKTCIIEGETVAYEKGKPMPFQKLSKRIKRKYGISEMTKEIPTITYLFDALLIDEKPLLDTSFEERRVILERILKPNNQLRIVDYIITDDEKKADDYFKKSLASGHEGLMVKSLKAPYKPGSRVGYGMKIKSTMESLDLVITGADWGEGRRANWLASFELSCVDDDTGEYLTIGKMGTGLKDEEFKELTETLKPLIIKTEGKTVKLKPKIVVEVAYEEIQKSTKYKSGYALRFPRMIRFRTEERKPEDAEKLSRIKQLFKTQRHG